MTDLDRIHELAKDLSNTKRLLVGLDAQLAGLNAYVHALADATTPALRKAAEDAQITAIQNWIKRSEAAATAAGP